MESPVYPKHDPEWEKKRKQILYDQIKRTNWMVEEYQGKPRGRKAKFVERAKAKLRPGERYDWLD